MDEKIDAALNLSHAKQIASAISLAMRPGKTKTGNTGEP